MSLVNLACLQTITDTDMAQRALAYFAAVANELDFDRMLAYRRAVEIGFYSDQVKEA